LAQQSNVEAAAVALAALAEEHELVVTHENSPCGMVGFLLELALRNALPDRDLVTVLSEVVVSPEDRAFEAPFKPISPEPQAIVAMRSLRTLIDAGVLVICAGGGIPVTLNGDGTMRGIEAVVDNDLTASLLARRLDADLFVMLTAGDAVRLDWDGGDERALGAGPKVEAAGRFVEATGRRAAIGGLTRAVEIVRGEAGTQILAPGA
jgi:carbamate kinase